MGLKEFQDREETAKQQGIIACNIVLELFASIPQDPLSDDTLGDEIFYVETNAAFIATGLPREGEPGYRAFCYYFDKRFEELKWNRR